MIAQNDIEKLVQTIVSSYKPEKVLLFGSYASGTATENSDVDLLLVKDTHLPPHKRTGEISALLKGILFPLDIIIYTHNEFEQQSNQKYTFLNNALTHSKVLYEQPRNNTAMVA